MPVKISRGRGRRLKLRTTLAAGSWTAEAQHGAEAGEEQHLVELAPEFQTVRAGENLIVGHVALGIDGDVQQAGRAARKVRLRSVPAPRLADSPKEKPARQGASD